MQKMICPHCGNVFIAKTRGRNKKYCSDKCRRSFGSGQKSYWEKDEEVKTENKPKKVATGSSIAEISRLAREAHMTYGQYVAVNHIS